MQRLLRFRSCPCLRLTHAVKILKALRDLLENRVLQAKMERMALVAVLKLWTMTPVMN